MSETAAGVVVTLLVCALIGVTYWKQLAVIVLLAVLAVFCVGVYHVVATYYP